jgi:hypothetical protein
MLDSSSQTKGFAVFAEAQTGRRRAVNPALVRSFHDVPGSSPPSCGLNFDKDHTLLVQATFQEVYDALMQARG